jgi:hypothetical protein
MNAEAGPSRVASERIRKIETKSGRHERSNQKEIKQKKRRVVYVFYTNEPGNRQLTSDTVHGQCHTTSRPSW